MENRRLKVSIVSFPVSNAFVTPLSNLANIFCDFSDRVNVIAGCVEDVALDVRQDNARIIRVLHRGGIAQFVITQARLALQMFRLRKETDLYIFFGQGPPLLNVLAARAAGKQIVWMLPSSLAQTAKLQKHRMSLLLAYLLPPCYRLSDRIIVYSDHLVGEWGLAGYRSKISIAHEHFVDTGKFRMTKKLEDRENIIGYIGRLSAEKGILDFMNAIPAVLKARPDARFLLIGNGPLHGQVRQFIDQHGLGERIRAIDWVSHDDLPGFFNELKLLVLPSYSEGIPNVMLEAMACGTPVLAAPVGAIPDILVEGVTGVSITGRSPEDISRGIVRAIDDPVLGRIADNARRLIDTDYVYTATVQQWKNTVAVVTKHSSSVLN